MNLTKYLKPNCQLHARNKSSRSRLDVMLRVGVRSVVTTVELLLACSEVFSFSGGIVSPIVWLCNSAWDVFLFFFAHQYTWFLLSWPLHPMGLSDFKHLLVPRTQSTTTQYHRDTQLHPRSKPKNMLRTPWTSYQVNSLNRSTVVFQVCWWKLQPPVYLC